MIFAESTNETQGSSRKCQKMTGVGMSSTEIKCEIISPWKIYYTYLMNSNENLSIFSDQLNFYIFLYLGVQKPIEYQNLHSWQSKCKVISPLNKTFSLCILLKQARYKNQNKETQISSPTN